MCKHNWVYKSTDFGAYTKLPWILVVLFKKPDFFRLNFVCSKCGEIKYIDKTAKESIRK
jgi:hypothetical protein